MLAVLMKVFDNILPELLHQAFPGLFAVLLQSTTQHLLWGGRVASEATDQQDRGDVRSRDFLFEGHICVSIHSHHTPLIYWTVVNLTIAFRWLGEPSYKLVAEGAAVCAGVPQSLNLPFTACAFGASVRSSSLCFHEQRTILHVGFVLIVCSAAKLDVVNGV